MLSALYLEFLFIFLNNFVFFSADVNKFWFTNIRLVTMVRLNNDEGCCLIYNLHVRKH